MGPGWTVGRYVVEDPAGFARGTFGTVYCARRLTDGAPVAMKLVLLTSAADSRERLEAERHGAMLQQRFEQAHGMVPQVYEYGPYNEHLYIAMEFVEGKSIAQLIKAGLTAQDAARHAAGICEFLDKAHRFETTIEDVRYDRIVHADLKPEHVLIAASGAMKVLDFGIAKALEKTTEVTTNNWSTVAYASPERLQSGGQVNVHADFWSLGVMLYEMVSGHLPYPSLTARHLRSQLEHAIRTNARPEPLPASCPSDLAAIVRKLMAHQIEHRYPAASAIKDDLDRFLAGARPAASEQYDTRATVPVRREPAAAAPVGPVQAVPPTEPFPMPAADAAATPAAAEPPRGLRHAGVRAAARRGAAFALRLALVLTVALEAVAWLAAERLRAGIHAMDGAAIAQKRSEFDAIASWGPLDAGLRLRVNGPLRARLLALADAVIADYRRDGPTMNGADWRHAREAMAWAVELTPFDPKVRARYLIGEAHLARLAARAHRRGTAAARNAYLAAIARFEAAAALDDTSFDPYLGISSIRSYGLDEVDLAADAIEQAERRGYTPGRRERAQLGDGYRRRGDRSRRRASTLSGEERRLELQKARADYARCVERFESIEDFGNAGVNLDYCRRHRDRIEAELDVRFELSWVM